MTTHQNKRTSAVRSLTHHTNSNRLITPEELAEAIGIPMKRLYTWRLKGVGPTYVKVGHNLRYRSSDIEDWLDANTSVSTDMTAR